MEKLQLVAHFAAAIITKQIETGVKHPSPALIKEAVETAEAVVDQLGGVLADDLEKRITDEVIQRAELDLKVIGEGLKKATADFNARLAALEAAVKTPAAAVAPSTGSATPAGADTSKK